MTAVKRRTATALCVLGTLVVSTAGLTNARAQTTAVEPDATRMLKRMTDYLRGLERFSVDTHNMLEDVLVSGEKIQNDFAASLVIHRPNKLRAKRTAYQLEQQFVYDGETLTVYNAEDNYYARTAVPDNIDDLLHFARDTLDIVPPVGDMVFTNAFELLTAGVTGGGVAGKAMIDGVECDHLFFSTPIVDWQVWIADGDRPLPYKYVLTTKDDPAQPQYIVLMSNWDVAPDVSEAMFEFTPPAGANEIEFLRAGAAAAIR